MDARDRLFNAVLKAAEWQQYYESLALRMPLTTKQRKAHREWQAEYKTLYQVAVLADDISPLTDPLGFTREIDNARHNGRSRANRDAQVIAESAA